MGVVIKTPLELAVDDLLTAVVFVQSTVQTTTFETLLKCLEITLDEIKLILEDNMLLNRVLDHREEETANFIRYMEKGKELILKCSRIKFWNVYKKLVYPDKLIQLHKELLRFFHSELENSTIDLYRLKIHIVGNSFESMMKTTHKEAPSIGNMVHDKNSSQTAGTNFSHGSPPSYSDVAPRKGSHASDGQTLSEVAPSIGDMVHDKEKSQAASKSWFATIIQ